MKLQIFWIACDAPLSATQQHSLLALLPEPLQKQCHRYRRPEDQRATLLGKLLLLYAIEQRGARHVTLCNPLENITYTDTKKPFIAGAWSFNISHSGAVVVLACASSGKVGVDVEQIRPIAFDEFVGHLPELKALDPAARQRQFYTYWTAKEAVLKGTGQGLLLPLEEVIIKEDTATVHHERWHIRQFSCGFDYCAHVATTEKPSSCVIERIYLSRHGLTPWSAKEQV
ncbi:4'-phosphopantetheinyl transferase family protein [Chrysiogenes arsenatis]|uniref:4'-phosphopantetheinyl transferase family protein n=1 Tax=Chrysiogenes arsenatis TaxID=309797 RepID=UPI0004876CB3|nr:4'-phosphopantetheinyl transferase superfamily protein [Chrysiogenes arsenatis]